jgi:hypothetical protein
MFKNLIRQCSRARDIPDNGSNPGDICLTDAAIEMIEINAAAYTETTRCGTDVAGAADKEYFSISKPGKPFSEAIEVSCFTL